VYFYLQNALEPVLLKRVTSATGDALKLSFKLYYLEE